MAAFLTLLVCYMHISYVTASATINTTLLILGGDDAGTGAAWAAAKLQVPTLLVLSHPADLGGEGPYMLHRTQITNDYGI